MINVVASIVLSKVFGKHLNCPATEHQIKIQLYIGAVQKQRLLQLLPYPIARLHACYSLSNQTMKLSNRKLYYQQLDRRSSSSSPRAEIQAVRRLLIRSCCRNLRPLFIPPPKTKPAVGLYRQKDRASYNYTSIAGIYGSSQRRKVAVKLLRSAAGSIARQIETASEATRTAAAEAAKLPEELVSSKVLELKLYMQQQEQEGRRKQTSA